jgi:SepF-like predicted cell division protein (DUF552 family)
MVNLFRLLGLPNPNPSNATKEIKDSGEKYKSENTNSMLMLSNENISERTKRLMLKPNRRVIYLKPDKLHRLHLSGMGQELSRGNMIIVDLGDLTHMPSQTAKCNREVNQLAENNGLIAFALNNSDTLIMIPGSKMRVDTRQHILGLSELDTV